MASAVTHTAIVDGPTPQRMLNAFYRPKLLQKLLRAWRVGYEVVSQLVGAVPRDLAIGPPMLYRWFPAVGLS